MHASCTLVCTCTLRRKLARSPKPGALAHTPRPQYDESGLSAGAGVTGAARDVKAMAAGASEVARRQATGAAQATGEAMSGAAQKAGEQVHAAKEAVAGSAAAAQDKAVGAAQGATETAADTAAAATETAAGAAQGVAERARQAAAQVAEKAGDVIQVRAGCWVLGCVVGEGGWDPLRRGWKPGSLDVGRCMCTLLVHEKRAAALAALAAPAPTRPTPPLPYAGRQADDRHRPR